MPGFGIEFLKFLEEIRTEYLNIFFESVTILGEDTILVLLIVSVYFIFGKEFAHRIFFSTITSLGVNGIIKNLVSLPRPFAGGKVSCVRPDTATGYSFPSGHTQNFATWSSTLAIKIKKRIITIISILLTALIAFSRMYLGAHYPGDVIVGAVLGFTLAYICNVLYDKIIDKHKLYIAVILGLSPFVFLFLYIADSHYEDFFKIYGMLLGFLCSTVFENRYVSLDYGSKLWKKILRVIIGISIALVIKESAEALLTFSHVRMLLASNLIIYSVLVFAEFGLCSLLFKKLNL